METYYLGIDPGTKILGFALISKNNANLSLIKSGIMDLSDEKIHRKKLIFIYDYFENLLKELKKENKKIIISIEKQFVQKNVNSAFVLIAVRTVFLLLAEKLDLEIFEFAPSVIKKNIFGSGKASKENIEFAVKMHFSNFESKYNDEADAIAIALASVNK